jgi:RimJ/RimL family protein N-acetyltransferase
VPQVVLHTPRLRLEPLADAHLEHEVELDSDPEVLRYLWGRARSRAEVERSHVERLTHADRVDGLGLWAGFLTQGTGSSSAPPFVGLWMLTPPHGPDQVFRPDEADLGYRVLRRYWRQGFASEGSRELLRHGFEDLGLTRIFAQTMAVNTPSRATMASLGMRFVRGFTMSFDEPLPGAEEGEVEYELRREDWLASADHATSGMP